MAQKEGAAAPKAGLAPHIHPLYKGEADSEGMLRARLSGRLDLGTRWLSLPFNSGK